MEITLLYHSFVVVVVWGVLSDGASTVTWWAKPST